MTYDIDPVEYVAGHPFWSVKDVLESVRGKLAADPDNQDVKDEVAWIERIAEFDDTLKL